MPFMNLKALSSIRKYNNDVRVRAFQFKNAVFHTINKMTISSLRALALDTNMLFNVYCNIFICATFTQQYIKSIYLNYTYSML